MLTRYEPEINRTYLELAQHYGAVVIPTRVARPKDKPKAEVSIQIAQRWVLAALRHQTFFTLADLNAAIGVRIDAINDRPMTVVGVSRRTLFEICRHSAVRIPACITGLDAASDHEGQSAPTLLVKRPKFLRGGVHERPSRTAVAGRNRNWCLLGAHLERRARRELDRRSRRIQA